MNPVHVKILAWEHGKRMLKTVVPLLLLFSSLDLAWQLIPRTFDNEFYDDILLIPLVGIFLTNILLLVSHTSNTDLQFSMNRYYLRLPMRPWQLACLRLALNGMTLLVVSGFFYWVHYNMFRTPAYLPFTLYPGMLGYTVSYILLGYLVVQLIAWACNTWVAISVIAVQGVLFIGWGDLAQDIQPFLEGLFVDGTLYWALFVCIALLILPTSGYVLQYARFSERVPVYEQFGKFVKRCLELIDSRHERDALPFLSKEDALVWLEKRYQRNLLTRCFVVALPELVPVWYFEVQGHFDSDSYLTFLLGAAMTLASVAVFAGVVIGLINFRRYSSDVKAFTLTKPVSTLMLAHARVHSIAAHMLKPAIILQVFILAVAGIMLFAEGSGLSSREFVSGLQTLMLVYLSYLGTLVLVWCALWCTTTFPLALLGVYLYAMLFFSLDLGDLLYNQYDMPAWGNRLVVGLTVAPIIVAWFVAGAKRLLLAQPWVWLFAPVLMLCVYMLLSINDLSEWDAGVFAMALIATMAAYLPFASAPLVAQFVRHR